MQLPNRPYKPQLNKHNFTRIFLFQAMIQRNLFITKIRREGGISMRKRNNKDSSSKGKSNKMKNYSLD